MCICLLKRLFQFTLTTIIASVALSLASSYSFLLCVLFSVLPIKLFGNIWLSMASLVIFMQLRYLFHEVQRRIRRHKNYLRVVGNMEAR